jgi:hypothetical protein
MSVVLNEPMLDAINHEIRTHRAWKGRMSGLKAEKMLRNKTTPYLYILREGETKTETETDYYVTFVAHDLSVKHQPFVITIAPEGWYYENHGGGGAYPDTVSIDDVLYMIMHCDQGANQPL